MTEPNELNRLINAVVDARKLAQEATTGRTEAYQKWQETNEQLFTAEVQAKIVRQEAEEQLRELALQFYSDTGEKSVAPGVGIRVREVLDYDSKEAFSWALEHKIALKLDGPAFEKIAKMAPETRPSFVTITEEPTATIATVLEKVE